MSGPKYNFVINCTDSELKGYQNITIESAFSIFSRYDLEWCLQAFLILKKRNKLNVVCSNHLVKDAINIIHSAQLLEIKGDSSTFLVCVQADFPHRVWAHYHIVQNKNQKYPNSSIVPLWIQPGLIKRDSSRKGITKVAYAGQIYNGNLAGSVEMWTNLFTPHDIEFTTLASGACNDMHDIDVLIGIRSFDTNTYDKKPPSKLINAWHAEIPFIGGNDSAFKQVATVAEDYLLALSAQEVLNAVLKLKNNQHLYQQMVDNGKRNASLYTQETIAHAWEDILGISVLKRYKKWLSRPLLEKIRFSALLNAGLLKHQAKQTVKKVLRPA